MFPSKHARLAQHLLPLWIRADSELPRKEDRLLIQRIRSAYSRLRQATNEELPFRLAEANRRLRKSPLKCSRALLATLYAIVAEAARRSIQIVPTDEQLLAAISLQSPTVAAMAPGEGKTFTIALPAVLHALQGRGVHIVAANQYLAKRGFETLQPVYEYLQLTVGLTTPTQSKAARKAALDCDITYGTADALTSDPARIQNTFAIVDDAETQLVAFGSASASEASQADHVSSPDRLQRYPFICGVAGSTSGIEQELKHIYGVSVVTIPQSHDALRQSWKPRCFASGLHKQEAVVQSIYDLHATGRPVLVFANQSAARSLAHRLNDLELSHVTLPGKDDEREAATIANAGLTPTITICSQSDVRGLDVRLSPHAQELGGLHVILSDMLASRRQVAQLTGRAARRGQPGSYQQFLSADETLVQQTGLDSAIVRNLSAKGECQRNLQKAISNAQVRLERQSSSSRYQSTLKAA